MKYILLPFLACIMINSQAQITGLGPFRIGDPPQKAIDTIQKITGFGVERLGVNDFAMQSGDSYKKATETFIFKDTSMPASSLSYMADLNIGKELSTEVYVDYIEIAGIPVRDLKLKYYKDSLIKISTSTTIELVSAFNEKYGKCTTTKNKKVVTCRSALAGSYQLEETSFHSSWENSKGIEVYSITADYYDDKCKKNYISTFTIQRTRSANELRKAEQEAKAQNEKKPNLNEL